MKSVLISIQPKWCELIASGKKTVEVRKTRPKLETPFKVYIYCTDSKEKLWVLKETERAFTPEKIASICAAKDVGGTYKANGKVIGEFVCDSVDDIAYVTSAVEGTMIPRYVGNNESCTCLSEIEIFKYGRGNLLYAWHISDLKIYDKPRELGEFYHYCGDNPECDGCEAHYFSNTECGKEDYCCSIMDGCKPLKRPPQSWMYVEVWK